MNYKEMFWKSIGNPVNQFDSLQYLLAMMAEPLKVCHFLSVKFSVVSAKIVEMNILTFITQRNCQTSLMISDGVTPLF